MSTVLEESTTAPMDLPHTCISILHESVIAILLYEPRFWWQLQLTRGKVEPKRPVFARNPLLSSPRTACFFSTD